MAKGVTGTLFDGWTKKQPHWLTTPFVWWGNLPGYSCRRWFFETRIMIVEDNYTYMRRFRSSWWVLPYQKKPRWIPWSTGLEGYTSTCWCCWSLRLAFWHPENLAKLEKKTILGPWGGGFRMAWAMLRSWLSWHCPFCWALAEFRRRYHSKKCHFLCIFGLTASFFRWFVQEIDRALPFEGEYDGSSGCRIGLNWSILAQVVLCC